VTPLVTAPGDTNPSDATTRSDHYLRMPWTAQIDGAVREVCGRRE